MSDSGVVRTWSVDEGWGVIDAPSTPGGCWALFSMLATESFWEPHAGQLVDFEWEEADQDGFSFRATRVWPSGSEPFDRPDEPSGAGFSSSITISFD